MNGKAHKTDLPLNYQSCMLYHIVIIPQIIKTHILKIHQIPYINPHYAPSAFKYISFTTSYLCYFEQFPFILNVCTVFHCRTSGAESPKVSCQSSTRRGRELQNSHKREFSWGKNNGDKCVLSLKTLKGLTRYSIRTVQQHHCALFDGSIQ